MGQVTPKSSAVDLANQTARARQMPHLNQPTQLRSGLDVHKTQLRFHTPLPQISLLLLFHTPSQEQDGVAGSARATTHQKKMGPHEQLGGFGLRIRLGVGGIA